MRKNKTSRLRAALPFVVAAVMLSPSRLVAQAVTGVGDDALMPKRGELRFSVSTLWQAWNERYGQGTAGRPNGALEPLGVDFNIDAIGPAQFEYLLPIQSKVQTLSGIPDFAGSLGTSRIQLHDNIFATPIAVEIGVTKRVSLKVTVPFVTATSNVHFVVNPSGIEPTLGFNPTLFAPAALSANTVFLAQFDSAAAQLNRSLTLCAATPGAAGCAPINANAAGARALITDANAFANNLSQLYGGRNGSAGALFVPISGTAAQSAIQAKVAAYRALYAAFGTTAITGTGPVAAQAPLTASDMQGVLTDAAFGINGKALETKVRHGIGNIDVGLKMNLFDSFRGSDSLRLSPPKGLSWRESVGANFRLGANRIPTDGEFAGLGTGDHQSVIALHSYTDLIYGPRYWVSLAVSYTRQMADHLTLRIPDSPSQVFLASYREEMVQRTVGDAIEVQINPHFNFNEYLGISGQYYFRQKSADVYSGKFSAMNLTGDILQLDASVLGMYTEQREHRLGIGATFSTVAASARLKAGVPFDISYFHYETTLGTLGRVPKISVDQVTVRIFQRIFGN